RFEQDARSCHSPSIPVMLDDGPRARRRVDLARAAPTVSAIWLLRTSRSSPSARIPMTLRFRSLLRASLAIAQQFDSSMFAGLHWRMIGPYRGGRTVASTGVRGQPNLFYVAATDGGVWKSTDYGRVWTPIFDQEPIGS